MRSHNNRRAGKLSDRVGTSPREAAQTMITIESYPVAVGLCVVTMLCWGSWANTLKTLRGRSGPFSSYWDYSIGVVLLALLLAITLGSSTARAGAHTFAADLAQADTKWLVSAFVGGVIFQPVEYTVGRRNRHRRVGRGLPGGCRPRTRAGSRHDISRHQVGRCVGAIGWRRLHHGCDSPGCDRLQAFNFRFSNASRARSRVVDQCRCTHGMVL